LPDVIDAIERAIGPFEGSLTWCLGGGTKLHQFAVSKIQEERWEAGLADQSVYSDPQRGVMTRIWRATGGRWESSDEPTSTDIGIHGILETFGREITSSTPPPGAPDLMEIARYRTDRSVRERWMADAGPQAAFGELLPYDRYLEHLVLHLTASALAGRTDLSLGSNVKVRGVRIEDQEHDVLLADGRGRLLSIDAKAGVRRSKGARKDLMSRLLQLQRSGGVPARFVMAFPYHRDDVNRSWFGESLRFLPLQLATWGLEFCVLTEDGTDFWIEREGKAIRFHSTAGSGRTRVPTLESLLGTWAPPP